MKAVEIAENIYFIGANIKNGDLFEGMWPIPDGVSLNSYIVKGDKTALIDLVRDWDNAPEALKEQLASLNIDINNIDYLVLNHLEPDHTGWLCEFLKLNPKVTILTTQLGKNMVKGFYKNEDNVQIVKDGEKLDLGNNMELTFYTAPNVHWPETMVTYNEKSGVLFSCDAFGSYGCVDNPFDDQLDDEKHAFYDRESLRYYANIVASFSPFVQKAIDKLASLDIKMIAPSHGIIWRENPSVIIERYRRFAEYMNGPAEPEITILWGSMYGNTESALAPLIDGIKSEGVTVHLHQVPNEDVSFPLTSAYKSAGLVFAMPTYEYRMFPPVAAAIDMFGRKHLKNKKVLRIGSYGWSGGAQKEFDSITADYNWDCLEPVEWQGGCDEDTKKKIYEQGKKLAKTVKEFCGV
ncbi:MAG: FprA family A-type flavoprotein [Spirochaetes bacterium]|nr:FprA family A-type flavoprotein [Spirochaetota bacterium]MBN2770975.1 FprA family A-type flavoprotein [Spirochaetota bacterium]